MCTQKNEAFLSLHMIWTYNKGNAIAINIFLSFSMWPSKPAIYRSLEAGLRPALFHRGAPETFYKWFRKLSSCDNIVSN